MEREDQELFFVNQEEKQMIEWLKKLRFQKKLFGGVSESDVWKKIEELNKKYHAALLEERARYDALLAFSIAEMKQQTEGNEEA